LAAPDPKRIFTRVPVHCAEGWDNHEARKNPPASHRSKTTTPRTGRIAMMFEQVLDLAKRGADAQAEMIDATPAA
jgi:hypothetical protein